MNAGFIFVRLEKVLPRVRGRRRSHEWWRSGQSVTANVACDVSIKEINSSTDPGVRPRRRDTAKTDAAFACPSVAERSTKEVMVSYAFSATGECPAIRYAGGIECRVWRSLNAKIVLGPTQ